MPPLWYFAFLVGFLTLSPAGPLFALLQSRHMQGLRKWRGRRASWVLIISFGTIVFNMAAVNFWVVGLHSYAR